MLPCRSHVIALWNNSPEDQTVSLEFSDVFTWNGKANQQASWRLHDLWAKDDDGKWGKSVGTFKTSVDGVQVRPHATRMYKAVRADEESKRSMSEL
jgi:alpha-galactosidase